MPKKGKYKPVSERNPQQVTRYNEAMRLHRLRKRIDAGKMPYPKKHTPGMEKIIESAGLADEVVIPRADNPKLTKRAQRKQTERRRDVWRNVKF